MGTAIDANNTERSISLDPNLSPMDRIIRIQNQQAQRRKMQEEVGNKDAKSQANNVNMQEKKSAHAGQFHKHKFQKMTIKNIFKWDHDKEGTLHIKPELKTATKSGPEPIQGKARLVNFLGHKINLTERANELMEKYQKLYIESRSSNYLLGRFSQLKFEMVQIVLSYLGVSTEELQELQKKAVKGAINENKDLFKQNEYNFELLTLFSATRDAQKARVLEEVRKQLMQQMEMLGEKGYYTKQKILEIKAGEVKKILQEVLLEKQNLQYIQEFQ